MGRHRVVDSSTDVRVEVLFSAVEVLTEKIKELQAKQRVIESLVAELRERAVTD